MSEHPYSKELRAKEKRKQKSWNALVCAIFVPVLIVVALAIYVVKDQASGQLNSEHERSMQLNKQLRNK